jgi:RHS repeat-associated protein
VWRWDQAEPFGNNPADENPSGLGTFDLPLRLPGQYYDKETNLHYNYHRYYDASLGIYDQSDPIGLRAGLQTYAYVKSQPLSLVDPLGLKARVCCRRVPWTVGGHCFIDEVSDPKCGSCNSITRRIGLQGPWPWGSSQYKGKGEIKTNDLFDDPKVSDCGEWNLDCATSACISAEASFYPNPSNYNALLGPNSNTFAGTIARACNIPQPVFNWPPPAWYDDPPAK